jgi:hypothetical protein
LRASIRHGSLYLADLSPRQGTEPGKARAVLVVQTDLLNEAEHPSTWILPCTTRLTGDSLLRVELPRGIAGNTGLRGDDRPEPLDRQPALPQGARYTPRAVLGEVKYKFKLLAEL